MNNIDQLDWLLVITTVLKPRPCGAIREGADDLEGYSSPCRGFDPRLRAT